jgi:hypothetical protein
MGSRARRECFGSEADRGPLDDLGARRRVRRLSRLRQAVNASSSWHERNLQDLPAQGVGVIVKLRLRRWRCPTKHASDRRLSSKCMKSPLSLRPGRLPLHSADRLLWVQLYRVWPRVLDALVLVKPVTVVKWHREGFRIYWRWRSCCPRRPKTSAEIRALIRRMSRANPLWGAPRIHGELLKLGIEVSQATVGRYLPRRRKAPSPSWRSLLRNHMTGIAAVDMFAERPRRLSRCMP